MLITIPRRTPLYWAYLMLVITILMGMVHKLANTDLTRRMSLVCKLLLMVILVFCAVANIVREKKLYVDDIPIVIYVAYTLIISLVRGLLIFPYAFVDILTWPCLYLAFKAYTRKRAISNSFVWLTRISMMLFFAISVLLIAKHRMGFGNAGGVVFPIYYCLTFLPIYLYLEDENRRKHVYFLIVIGLLMISTKRAGTVVAAASYIIYLFSNTRVSEAIKHKKRKYRNYIFGLLVCFCGIIVLDSVISLEIIERLKGIVNDQGSGRTYIWSFVFKDFKKANESLRLFGHGYQAVYYQLKPFGVDRLAHNSFLELLYDYGYVGLSIFLLFFINMIKKCILSFAYKDKKSPYMLITMVICIAFGVTSYLFEESAIMMPIAVFWGCFDGENRRKRTEKSIMIEGYTYE